MVELVPDRNEQVNAVKRSHIHRYQLKPRAKAPVVCSELIFNDLRIKHTTVHVESRAQNAH